MAPDFTQRIVIAVSSRALFELSHENEIFEKQGTQAYSAYQLEHENDALSPGVAFPLVKGILQLNDIIPGTRKAEVIVMSRNNPDISLRIFTAIQSHGLDITKAAFTSGAPISDYLRAFNVDLFLSAHQADVQVAVDAGFAAARVLNPPEEQSEAACQIRIAFDGDAVLFSEQSEKIYQRQGLEAFVKHERANVLKPLSAGPFAKLLKSLSFMQNEFKDRPEPPIRTALVTSRNSPTHERVIRTLREWRVHVDEAFFLGDLPKDEILRVFKPHIFFDDSDRHALPASRVVPVAQVPHASQLVLPGGIAPILPAPTTDGIGKPRPRKKVS